jgi:hypothetical protein
MQHLYSFSDFVNEGKVEDLHAKYYSDIEPATFHQIVTADPTSIVKNDETKKMGTYSKWLLKLFQDGKLLLEDLYKATEYLTLFDKLKAQKVSNGAAADINRYGSLPDLSKYIKEIGGTGETTEDESYLLEDRYFINQGEAVLFHEDNDYLIVIPRTLKASQFYAHQTEWCTKYPDMFKEYSGQGDLYIIIDKHKLNTDDDNRMMQFHFHSAQFMDIYDRKVSLKVRIPLYPYFKLVKGGWMLRYDSIGVSLNNTYLLKSGGKYGHADLVGNIIIPCVCDAISVESEGLIPAMKGEVWGVYDTSGKVVIPFEYDAIGVYKNGKAFVKLKSKFGEIDREGNVQWGNIW